MPNPHVPAAATGLPAAFQPTPRETSLKTEETPVGVFPNFGENLPALISREKLRTRIESAVTRLIAALDAIDGPADDLELDADDDQVDGEPSLGARPLLDQRQGWDDRVGSIHDADMETEADDEPVLGAPEISATCTAVIQAADGQWLRVRADQTEWAKGASDEREVEDEHSADDDQGECSLGWTAAVNQAWPDGWDVCHEDGEPSLGSPERHPRPGDCNRAHSQTMWSAGGRSDASVTGTAAPVGFPIRATEPPISGSAASPRRKERRSDMGALPHEAVKAVHILHIREPTIVDAPGRGLMQQFRQNQSCIGSWPLPRRRPARR